MKIDHKETVAIVGRTVELSYKELEILKDTVSIFDTIIAVRNQDGEDVPKRGYTTINAITMHEKDSLVDAVVNIAGFLNQVVQDVEPSTVVEDKLFGRTTINLEKEVQEPLYDLSK